MISCEMTSSTSTYCRVRNVSLFTILRKTESNQQVDTNLNVERFAARSSLLRFPDAEHVVELQRAHRLQLHVDQVCNLSDRELVNAKHFSQRLVCMHNFPVSLVDQLVRLFAAQK